MDACLPCTAALPTARFLRSQVSPVATIADTPADARDRLDFLRAQARIPMSLLLTACCC